MGHLPIHELELFLPLLFSYYVLSMGIFHSSPLSLRSHSSCLRFNDDKNESLTLFSLYCCFTLEMSFRGISFLDFHNVCVPRPRVCAPKSILGLPLSREWYAASYHFYFYREPAGAGLCTYAAECVPDRGAECT
jgi:hypothetical protein